MRHPFRFLALACLIGAAGDLARAQTLPALYPPLTAKETEELDKQWRSFHREKADESSRDLYAFILTAAARGWHPERLAEAIDHVEEFHERDPQQKGYGNYRWYRKNPHPDDQNAVQFCMQTASLTWVLYRDRLPPEARAKLEAALHLASEGVLRQVVRTDYTNIFLMRLANAILLGQSTGRTDMVEQGRKWFDEWFAYTRQNGIHEFSSPTYYGVDLDDLGALSRFAADPQIRAMADRALALVWTDLAANWYEPHQGITGANSRDYGFLTGHGYLDQQLHRANWIRDDVSGESRPVLDDLTHVEPPAGVHVRWPGVHVVSQQYGPKPGERANHYVGEHFTLGSAGEMYGAQDRMLALTFDGGPKQPIASLSLEYRNDPYGRQKVASSGGHDKLTHLQPLIGTVQNGPEVLQVAYFDPTRGRNPAGKGGAAFDFAGIWASLTLPRDVTIWIGEERADGDAGRSDRDGSPIFVRSGSAAAAIKFVYIQADTAGPADIFLARDGNAFGAQRLGVKLADEKPTTPVAVALWIRAAEGLDDATFAKWRAAFEHESKQAKGVLSANQLAVSVPGHAGEMAVTLNLKKLELASATGMDPKMEQGILNVDGRDVGTALLR